MRDLSIFTPLLLLPPTLPPQTKPLPPLRTPVPLQICLLFLLFLPLLRLPAPEILPVRRHPIAYLPLPLVELDDLRDLDLREQLRAPRRAFRAQGLDFPALVGVRDQRAGRRVGRVGRDASVDTGYEGVGGEVAVAAGGVDEEAVAAHDGVLFVEGESQDVYTR